MANTVNNPGIPYVGPIPGGIHDGLQIHISGTPEHHHNGFQISLQAGHSIDPRSECAFVFNPRFNENQVIRNSLQGGSWGAEERHGGFPFRQGQHCEVTIHVKHHHYSVSVNGRHFCDYNHRLQKHRVTHITVEQGIRVNTIRFQAQGGGRHGNRGGGGIGAAIGSFAGAMFNEFNNVTHHPPPPQPTQPFPAGGGAFPAGGGGYPAGAGGFPAGGGGFPAGGGGFPAGGYPAPGGAPMYNPPVPFVHTMGGLYPNKMIFISGIPHPNASRFTVYLQHGLHHEPNLVAMCFDARFMFGNDRNCVVRNHKQHNNWGTEERHVPVFPFMPNTNFEMIILVEPNCFKVAVNNQHLLEFNHRVQPLSRVDTLRIDGDLRLTQVRFQ